MRDPVSKRTRFEVFKRDKFTCQYCGAQAPDVILHCDHIIPVAGGGASDILNLITACSGCNGGKGAVPLSDHAALEKQRDRLAELEERRQQIEMMVEWRDTLRNIEQDTVSLISDRVTERGLWSPNENGLADIRRWLKKYSVEELLRAIDESMDTYLLYVDGKPTSESWNKAFSKIPGVADILRQEEDRPHLRRLIYIQGILRKRTKIKRLDRVEYLEHLVNCGFDIDEIERRAKRANTIDDFDGPYDRALEAMGRPY